VHGDPDRARILYECGSEPVSTNSATSSFGPTRKPKPRNSSTVSLKTSDVRRLIKEECRSIEKLLLTKNKDYGNSALEPLSVFSSLTPIEALKARIDDKIRRVQNITKMMAKKPSSKVHHESLSQSEADLIGYLILKRVIDRLEAETAGG
jgi:hypothetical protein